jgi:16S rRNA (guanine527-N7)-methyltransferase
LQARCWQQLRGRYDLDLNSMESLGTLLDLLLSDPLAPTAIRDPGGALRDHLADALVALELPELRDAGCLLDIGSGPGIPALPLAATRPKLAVTALDSQARKTTFVQRAISTMGLSNAQAVTARAEAWPAGIGRFDLVTARALAPLDVVAEYAAPLLQLGGTMIAWRGRRDSAGEDAARRAAGMLGLEEDRVVRVFPYPGAEHRHLHLLRKVAITPDRFPRRPGTAGKRPLGSQPVRSDRGPR